MSMLVSYSETPLVLDAVSALKVTHYCGHSALDDVYAYFRAFVCGAGLTFSLTSFERRPPRESRVGAALCLDPQAEEYLFFSTNGAMESECALYREQGGGPDLRVRPLALPQQPAHFGGSDEQGFYWGCEVLLDEAFLRETFGVRLRPGSVFTGNVYKYAAGEAAFGAAFPSPPGAGLPCRAGFGEFVVVPY